MNEITRCFPVVAQDIFNYLASKHFANNQICCILRLAGRVNEIILYKTIRLSLDIEPILGCRFIENDGHPVWKQREDLDSIELCSVVKTQEIDSELQQFIGDRLDNNFDCQIKAKVFRAAI